MKRIMIVDGDSGRLDCCKAILQEAGYEVLALADRIKALMEYCGFRPDLMILDARISDGRGERAFDVGRKALKDDLPAIFFADAPECVDQAARAKNWISVACAPFEYRHLPQEVQRLIALKEQYSA